MGLYLSFAGTNADIMKVGGYKLSALEIEAVLLEASTSLFCTPNLILNSSHHNIHLIFLSVTNCVIDDFSNLLVETLLS